MLKVAPFFEKHDRTAVESRLFTRSRQRLTLRQSDGEVVKLISICI